MTKHTKFTFDANTGFLTPNADLPAGWREDQTVLADVAAEKNAHKGCKGINVNGELLTVVLRQGSYLVRGARGTVTNGHSNGSRAEKRGTDTVSQLLNNREGMIASLDDEHNRLTARLSEVDKMRAALAAM